MSKVTDITSILDIERPVLKVFDKEYEVNNHWTKVIGLTQLQKKMSKNATDEEGIHFMNDVLVLFLGEESTKEIQALNVDIAGYRSIFESVISIATGKEVKLDKEDEEKETVTP